MLRDNEVRCLSSSSRKAPHAGHLRPFAVFSSSNGRDSSF
ncbi:hypothetical protein CAMRE0001_2418 [Campylobacter rectus RM3267]|uniref:Uncharacterized protein n=1 Tax=Campylobacter rectus RM3267 TaxID=553218 RepID=B9D1R5_CAMRE|nr:hypothetical protein CAMRE0001_2418 [Campylobacter rectus RM3267]